MSHKTLLIFLLSLTFNLSYAQNNECSRVTNFGKTSICLPKIDTYTECYTDPKIKILADATEVPSNMVLGYYLNKNTYLNKDNSEQIIDSDYFKIYATLQMKEVEVNSGMLKQIQQMVGSNFATANWDNIKKEIKKSEVGALVDIQTPKVIKNYSLNDNSFTFIVLAKYEAEGLKPYVMAMSINGLIINEKLIWMAYYLNFENEETIVKLEKQNETILNSILNNNS